MQLNVKQDYIILYLNKFRLCAKAEKMVTL